MPQDTAHQGIRLRVCFGVQLWVPNVVNSVVASCGSNVVSSCGCELVKKRSPQIAPKHVLTRRGQKRGCELLAKNVTTATMRDRCFCKKWNVSCFCFFFALRQRLPFGILFSSTLVFAHDATRNSGTTLLPHVVTSLQPLCNSFSSTLLHEPCSPKFVLKYQCHHLLSHPQFSA